MLEKLSYKGLKLALTCIQDILCIPANELHVSYLNTSIYLYFINDPFQSNNSYHPICLGSV